METSLLVFLLISLAKVIVVVVITLMAVAYTVLLERKLVGRIQNRWGPSRVGPFGLLQPLADGAKLFLKEDLMPEAVYRPLYILAPMIALICALMSIAVVPFGADVRWKGVQLFEIALGLSLVGVVLRSQSLNLRHIVDVQATHGLLSWNFFGGFQFIAFFIYLMAAYAETNRAPFDLPEAESELTAGYHTEYSSMKFAMFFMAEYANMITVGCVATLLFFGGWTSPFGNLLPQPSNPIAISLLSLFWFVVKVLFFLFLYIWVRGTLPRLRYDQLMGFGWKFLVPVAVANIVVTSFFIGLRLPLH